MVGIGEAKKTARKGTAASKDYQAEKSQTSAISMAVLGQGARGAEARDVWEYLCMVTRGTLAWIDISAGVAGDMLVGALVDAGAQLKAIQSAVDAVIPGEALLSTSTVTRAGMRATKFEVGILEADSPPRTWTAIQTMLGAADLATSVRSHALTVFRRLAEAEGQVHGIPTDNVHFHEVGAVDSIADIVGVCAALHDLGIAQLTASEVSLGAGRVEAVHGEMPVPSPAVLELARGWTVRSGGTSELATPTGLALVTAIATSCNDIPPMTVNHVGVGAGSKDFPGRANVVRVAVGTHEDAPFLGTVVPEVVLEANVDDLDPRLWPGVLTSLLDAGASDAWLSPIVMKKGRPAHTLHVLAPQHDAAAMRQLMFEQTSTIGVRTTAVSKTALLRSWIQVDLPCGVVQVKVCYFRGRILTATPEFEDVVALARQMQQPVRHVLAAATAAAVEAGLISGAAI